MKVSYDNTLKITGIGVTPWPRLGLERWFPSYNIVCTKEGGTAGLAHMPEVLLVQPELTATHKTQQLIGSHAFEQLAGSRLADQVFVTYKPMHMNDADLRRRFLMMDPRYTKTYENKAWLRQTFGTALPFAPYKIHHREELVASQEMYQILQALSDIFVMQHEQLSGGTGTYVVHSFGDFEAALQKLPQSGSIVISAYIAGAKERSLQACLTRYGVTYGGLQKQLVRTPELCNLQATVVNGFSGGEIGTLPLTAALQKKIDSCVAVIAAHMKQEGYKGIFGIDFLVRDEEVFVLEINARLTGMTPLLTLLNGPDDIPFCLLHVLELSDQDYTVQPDSNGNGLLKGTSGVGSMMILQSHETVPARVDKMIPAGIYTFDEGKLVLRRPDIYYADTDPAGALLIQNYAAQGSTVKPGGQLITVMTRQPIMDTSDRLLDKTQSIISALYAAMRLQPITASGNS